MNITKGILLNDSVRHLAFCGGQGRLQILRRMIEELSRKKHKILVTALPSRLLPIYGEIVMGRQIPLLVNQLSRVFQEKNVIFTGSQLFDGQLHGFAPEELSQLIDLQPADYLLIDGGPTPELLEAFAKPAGVPQPWDQLVYYVDIEHTGIWPEKSDSSDVLNTAANGADQQAPFSAMLSALDETILLLGDSSGTRQENRAISLARELARSGYRNLALANLVGNRIEKIRL